MNKQLSANGTITLPPRIWAMCASPRCAGTATLSDGEEFVNTGWQSSHRDAGSHPPPLCWEMRGIQTALFQKSSAGCVGVGSCAWFYHGNSQKKQQVQERCMGLLVAECEHRALLQICVKLISTRCSPASRSAAENKSHQEVILGNVGKGAVNSFPCSRMYFYPLL